MHRVYCIYLNTNCLESTAEIRAPNMKEVTNKLSYIYLISILFL